MSTELRSVPAVTGPDTDLRLTQYCGPAHREDETRLRLQLTQGPRYVTMSKSQAAQLAAHLLRWSLLDDDTPDYEG